MSKRRRNAKRTARARWWNASGIRPPESSIGRIMREAHARSHPHCRFPPGVPHFVPPSLGDEGFYLCDVDGYALLREA